MRLVWQSLLVLLLGAAAGLRIRVTEPNRKTVWKTHSDVDVFWKTFDANDLGLKTIDIDLWKGGKKGKAKPDLVRNICFGVTYDHGDSFWTVDPKLMPDDDYYLRITSQDNPDFVAESEHFEIEKGSSKDAGRMKISHSSSTNAGRASFCSMSLAIAAALASLQAVLL